MVEEIYKELYCGDALKMLGINVVCGKKCPLFGKCPRIIMEDGIDEVVTKSIDAMIKGLKKRDSEEK